MVSTNSIELPPKKEAKTAKTLSLIVLSFIICWLPMTISFFLFSALRDREFSEEILSFAIILSHCNSAIDPIIYAYRIKDVREALKNFLRCQSRNRLQRDFTLNTVIKRTSVKNSDS